MKVQIKYPNGRVRCVSARDAKLLVSLKKAAYVTEAVEGPTPVVEPEPAVDPDVSTPTDSEGGSNEVPEDTEVQKVLVPETVEASVQTRTYRRRDMQAEGGKSAPVKKATKKAAKKVAPKKSAGRSAE